MYATHTNTLGSTVVAETEDKFLKLTLVGNDKQEIRLTLSVESATVLRDIFEQYIQEADAN
jgi:hypothetical protein